MPVYRGSIFTSRIVTEIVPKIIPPVFPEETDTPTEFDFDVPGAGLLVNLDSSISESFSFSGSKITSWIDQKNGLNFSQAIDINRPVLDADGVLFSGAQRLITPAFAPLALTSAMSIYVVSRPVDILNPAYSTLVSHTTGANGYLFRYGADPSGEARFNFPARQDISANVTSYESGVRNSIGVIFGGGNFQYRKNGALLGTQKNYAGSAISANVPTYIGSTNSGAEGWVGTISHVLIYSNRLTGKALIDVEQALNDKWGI